MQAAGPPSSGTVHQSRRPGTYQGPQRGPHTTGSGPAKPQKHQEPLLLPKGHFLDEKKVGLGGAGAPCLGPPQLLLTYAGVGHGACGCGSGLPSRVR